MIDKFADMKGQLSELATVLNRFNSEAVQLRLLDIVFGKQHGGDSTDEEEDRDAGHKAPRKPSAKAKTANDNASDQRKKSSLGTGTRGTGARATLTQLIEKGFFDKPQTINSIIGHCKVNRARAFKQSDFSGSLARMVRNGQLGRKKNEDKQYEYKKP
jgi:hypothetical protein